MDAVHFRAYLQEVQRLIEEAGRQAGDTIAAAASLIAGAVAEGRVLYVFGPSHAGLLAQDLFYRAGGLVSIDPILPGGLMLNERPVTRTSYLEQLSGYAETVLRDLPLSPGDVLLVISVSGRNPMVVEMCTGAQARGARVIALTSLAYSRSVSARGTARLFEVADLVIDLPGNIGDAAIALEGLDQRVGPTSTAVGSAMLHGLMVEVAGQLLARGVEPPVFISNNLDGAAEKNARLLAAYRGRVSYL